jgi:hypothetical protein
MFMSSRRISAIATTALAVVLMVWGTTAAFAQSGAQSASPPSITDYANYPLGLGIIPAGCTTQGAGILTGTQYSMNGGAPVGDLAALGQIPADATITMTWTGYAPNCEGIGVSLSRKIAQQVGFSEADNQYLNAWSYCGPQGNPCTGMTLTLDLSQAAPVACYQMDANVGPPLQIVGPGGAFYSINGEFNTLLSANNGGAEPCAPAPCPVPGSPPDMPASAAACQDLQATTTTAAPTTAAPTTAPSSTAPPVTTSGPGQVAGTSTSTAPCGPNQQRDAATGQCVAVLASGGALPFTGSRSSEMAGLGAVVLGAGLLALVASRRFRSNPLR